jgi:hypothetical protein
MISRILASMTAVLGAAGLTLACLIALVQGTIRAVELESLPLRFLAVAADLLLGTSCLSVASTSPPGSPF